MKYAGIVNNTVIIIDEINEKPVYPPTNDGLKVITMECDDTVQVGDKVVDGKIIGTYNPKPEPTQLDKLEENQLALMEAVADQYEEHLQNRINDMEVQASIYEAVLALGGE